MTGGRSACAANVRAYRSENPHSLDPLSLAFFLVGPYKSRAEIEPRKGKPRKDKNDKRHELKRAAYEKLESAKKEQKGKRREAKEKRLRSVASYVRSRLPSRHEGCLWSLPDIEIGPIASSGALYSARAQRALYYGPRRASPSFSEIWPSSKETNGLPAV